ncbi:hypothetical protein TNCV_2674411 [Trichonephila clavipes]|nr:hypothetical protein TNCV_2674411 [Trichonephila clavipes]
MREAGLFFLSRVSATSTVQTSLCKVAGSNDCLKELIREMKAMEGQAVHEYEARSDDCATVPNCPNHIYVLYLTFSFLPQWLDSPGWTLAFSRNLFQASLLTVGVLQFLVLKARRSFSRPSIHRFVCPFYVCHLVEH